MRKTEMLKKAYNELKQGKIIQSTSDDGYTKCIMWISKNPNKRKRYICWRCYGESANAMSINNLRWIFKVIGKCTTYEFKVVNTILGD